MKTRFWPITLLLMIALMAACQTANPAIQSTQQSAPSVQTGETVVETESYPVPDQTQLEAATAPSGQSLYPEPQSGDEVSWAQANELIKHNEVTKVFVSKSLQVTLTLKDGRSLIAIEPSTGSMEAALKNCGEPCQGVAFESE